MSERSDRSWSAVAIGGVALLGAAFLWEVLSLTGVPIARDMQLFFIPQRYLLWTALQAGHLPLWTPLLGNGTPLLANFQSGVFYPPNWLYAALPFFAAFNGLLVLHFVVGGVFTYLFCRVADYDRSSASAAAIGYMLGGYFVSLTNLLNVLQVAAWAPAVCWGILVYARSRSVGSFVLLVAVLWLAFMAGEPLTFALAVALGGGYGVVRRIRGRLQRGALALIVALAAAGLLVGGLAAMQVLPTAEFVSESDRAGGLSYEESERYHLEPVRLIHLAVPPEYGDPVYRFGRKAMLVTVEPWLFSVYLGAVALILIAAARLDRDRRLESLYWAAVGALGLVLSLGDATPLYGFLYRHLPGFASFRFPERFLFLTGFSAAMLAGTGLSALRAVRRPVRLDGVLGAGALALVTGFAIAWSVYAEPLRVWGEAHLPEAPFFQNFAFAHAMWAGNLWRIVVLVAIALLVIKLYRRGIFRESLLVALLLGLLTLDLWTAHRQLTPVADRSFFEEPPVLASLVPFAPLRTDYRYRASPFDEDITRFHTLPGLSLQSEKWTWQQTVQPNLGALHGILTHDSGDAIHLSRGVDQSTFLAMLPTESRWRVLRLASVRWVYSYHGFDRNLYGSRTRLDSLPGFVYELKDPLPRAYVARQAVLVDEEVEAFNASITREFDPRTQVALLAAQVEEAGIPVWRDPVDSPDDGGDSVYRPAATIVADEGTEIRIAVSPSSAGYLVLTDSDYPGWSAHVDGEERPILLANYSYRAVPVRPGDREVVFTYRSRPFLLGRRISAVTLVLLLIGLGLVPVIRRRIGRVQVSPAE
ncbi:MAG: hypothetical protein P8Y15_03420 [Gemmatimonadales bacterium]